MSNVIPMNPAAGSAVIPPPPGAPSRPQTFHVPLVGRPPSVAKHCDAQVALADQFDQLRDDLAVAKRALVDANAQDIARDVDLIIQGFAPVDPAKRSATGAATAVSEIERQRLVVTAAGRVTGRALYRAVREERDDWIEAIAADETNALEAYNNSVRDLQKAASTLAEITGGLSWLREADLELPNHRASSRFVARIGRNDFPVADLVNALAGAPEASRPKKPQTVTGREAKFGDAA